MITALAALLAVTAPIQDPTAKMVDYHNKGSGFIFSRPEEWKFTKLKNSDRFIFQINETDVATLDITSISFSGEPEIWQASQARVAEQQKRSIARQWQEEILQVPLLLTQTTWQEDSQEVACEAGIIYAATPLKFVYRLTAPQRSFDSASYIWRTVLQTLRTDTGSPVQPFDRSKGPSANELGAGKRTVYKEEDKQPHKVEKGTESIAAEAGGAKLVLRFAAPWKVEKEENKYKFTHPQLSQPVTVEVYSSLDSLPVGRHLMRQNAKSLEPFTKVNKRYEPTAFQTKSGMLSTYVLREGLVGDKFRLTIDGVGANDAREYWYVFYMSEDSKLAKKEANLIIEFMNSLSVDPAE
jgi:hypothetical protein